MEAVHLALGYAFEALGMQQVWGVTPWHTARALCVRCGFAVMAEIPEFTRWKGRPQGVTVLRKLRD